jgi:hypothetical protein
MASHPNSVRRQGLKNTLPGLRSNELLGVHKTIHKTIVLDFPGTLGPLPKATCDLHRQVMPQLAGHHHNLSPVMTFVRDEIAQNVTDVEGKVAPYIRRRAGNASPLITAEL